MDLNTFLHIFIPLFAVIDPFAALPLYMSLTAGLSEGQRRKIVKEASITAIVLLIFFEYLGIYILDFMGISIEALMIAGGLLMLMVSIEMVKEGDKPRSTNKKTALHEETGDVGIVPLGTPMLAGPGAISLVIILMGKYPGESVSIAVSIISIVLLTSLIFLGANYISRIMGEKGARAFTRVMGLLVAAFAVQYILDGIAQYFGI
ncbi:membrane protein, MarC family [Aciduliprofundum sp. MAR08-339]|uniref:MarC family protein n=1 Tax=Aciduliprofundum sp. (strain MAR08-339) TaxID=673860 RepID=UPI0002A484DD|nr:membrane protein, MarC family [Aciduliprofundum sp. MAR08-339]